MNYKDIKTKEEYSLARAEYKAAHPDLPEAKEIACLNLLIRKEFAQQILKGEKKVEFRAFSEHYCGRLIDSDVDNWMTEQRMKGENASEENKEKVQEAMYFANHVRPVKKIHFHNYNNTWTLDVECVDNDYVFVTDKDVDYLHQEYDCHELDDILADFNRRKESNRPIFFFFAIGKILNVKGL